MHEDVATFDGFIAMVKTQKSKVKIVCNVCNYIAETSIGNFHFKGKAGCQCSGKPLWSTEWGHRRFLETLEKSSFEVVNVVDAIAWQSRSITQHTTLKLLCKVCGYVAEPTISNFVKAGTAPCWCHVKSAPYATDQGRQRILYLLEGTRFNAAGTLLDADAWRKLAPGAHDIIDLLCTKCGTRPECCSISNFVRSRGALCWCSESRPYNGEDGRLRVLAMAEQSQMQPSGWMLCPDEWTHRNVMADTKLLLKCKLCNVTTESTTLAHFVRNPTTGCMCKWKTQTMVLNWMASKWTICREYLFDAVKSRWGGNLPYDCAVMKNGCVKLLLEIDGRQHFEEGRLGLTGARFDRKLVNDLDKEVRAIENGIPLVRMYQEDVWENRFDWKATIEAFVHAALCGELPIEVHRQPHQLYRSGEYARVRKGTKVEV